MPFGLSNFLGFLSFCFIPCFAVVCFLVVVVLQDAGAHLVYF
jgi:hypothetical protein